MSSCPPVPLAPRQQSRPLLVLLHLHLYGDRDHQQSTRLEHPYLLRQAARLLIEGVMQLEIGRPVPDPHVWTLMAVACRKYARPILLRELPGLEGFASW
jgi:hypothetical protein